MTYEWYHWNGCPEKYATLEECRTTIGIFKIPGFLSCLLLYIKPSQTLVAWTKKKKVWFIWWVGELALDSVGKIWYLWHSLSPFCLLGLSSWSSRRHGSFWGMFQEGKCQDTSPCQDSADFMFTDVSLAKAGHMVPDSTPGEPRGRSDSLGTLLIHVKHMLRDRQKKRSHWRKTHESLSERTSKTSRKQSF